MAPTAVVSGDVSVGEESRVLHGAILTSEGGPVTVGRSCVVMENAVLLPIYNLRSFWVGRSNIKGLQFTRVGYPYFHDVTLA